MSSASSASSSSLLTPNEQQAFNAFLNGVDDPEWSDPSRPGWTQGHADWPPSSSSASEWQTYAHLAPPPAEGSDRDALSKATKDLIALHPPPKFTAHRPIAPAPPPVLSLPLRLAPTFSPTSPQAQIQTQKRPSSSNSHDPASKRRRAASPPSPPLTKSTLLSAQQKKANHIQSEQKRRANIRRGYEALCETIPALREAIRADEEGSVAGFGTGGAGGRRRRATARDEEKVDGRAGPRSESVVLQKTIEHICGMLDEKNALLARLDRARSLLGTGHPMLYPQSEPLWERDWDGGKGIMMDVDGEQDSDEDE